ncbi:MAG: hypothetical protein Q7T00_01700 [Rugosibacter sp.]|nr:hypothetical protein [Rugosibacter sp.]MDO9271602.1 hypothetical protein [Rugosibacter sp.]
MVIPRVTANAIHADGNQHKKEREIIKFRALFFPSFPDTSPTPSALPYRQRRVSGE